MLPKPFATLNRADLEQAPIWEWAPEDSSATENELADESFVYATQYASIPMVDYGQFVVSADITLKEGGVMPGICEVSVAAGELAVVPEVVFMLDRQLTIPAVETNRLLSRYTKTLENYPTGFVLKVLVEGERELRSGSITAGDMKDLVAVGMDMLNALKSLRAK
ncbi:hypothetical protein [Methylomonas rhizoryzae]|uniref:hypothetical protein n=1 Tax=Methylomonas rhizoryzae TaxID=2608981 RepID=UPI001232C38F|nr:hypothetical protein [Methylomonas rhizoryzae]